MSAHRRGASAAVGISPAPNRANAMRIARIGFAHFRENLFTFGKSSTTGQ
jgi:hypothetical protein